MFKSLFTEECPQYDSFGLSLELVGQDLTGFNTQGQLRDVNEQLAANLDVKIIDGARGQFDIELIHNALPLGAYYGDVFFTKGELRVHGCQFKLVITKPVTQDEAFKET